MSEKKKKLTDKEEAFCQAYVNDADPNIRWNKTQSAIKAGYSEKSARELGYETMTKLHVKGRIKELIDESSETNEELIQRVKERYKQLAFTDENKIGKLDITSKETIAALKGLASYLGMDKQNIDITSGGEKLPTSIKIELVKSE